ncbi:MAG: hypothetical protein ACW99U_12405 [Candidatus Thorarchaeota archaeon]
MGSNSRPESNQQMQTPELIESMETTASEQDKIHVDEKSRKLRKHLAQVKALRQLENTKARVLALSRVTSINR